MIKGMLLFLGLAVSAWADPYYLSDDIVVLDRQPVFRSFTDAEDCRPLIKESVCVVEPGGGERECLPESADYVALFERIHDRLPAVLQKVFCSVERIYIEKELKSTAYASPFSAAIGMRKSLLDEKLTFAHWATWKEQLSFGGKLNSYKTDETLPTFVSTGTHEDFVMNVVIHEFGHLLDYANDLNVSAGSAFKAGTWGALSWKALSLPLPQFDYPDRSKICFYDCDGSVLAKGAVKKIYEDLYSQSNFLNTYTSRNAREDFADTFAFYYTFLLSDISYELDTRAGTKYDFRAELASARMKAKRDYVKAFVTGTILYPER